jgi:NADPH-dependent curcumin reductase CurA
MPRDSVLVAGATGSVGSIAAQLAPIAGAYAVGLAGGEHRCTWVRQTLGIDEMIESDEVP